jgi:hypothetical protein
MVNLNLINGNVLDKIIPAFFAAKRAFEPVVKNQTNLSCKSSYAVLAAIEDAITPGLTKHGLFFQQPIQIEENDGQVVIKIETILWHCSGQVLSSLFTIPYEGKKTPHTLGSFITYFRCYLLLGFLGIATHDNLDDDANRSQGVLPSTSDQTPSTDPSTENKEVSSELPSADLSKTDPPTENKEEVSSELPSADLSKPVLPSTSDQTPSTDPSTENQEEVSSELPSADLSKQVLPSTLDSDQTPSTDPSTENQEEVSSELPSADLSKTDPSTENKEVSSELPSADLSKTDPSTENKENVKIFCSLVDQLPKDKREQLIAWGLEKQYYSKTEENFLFDSIPPETLEKLISRCRVVVDENIELDSLRQCVLDYVEKNEDMDIQAFGKEIGIETATSVFDFTLEQLRELNTLCKEKQAEAWDTAKSSSADSRRGETSNQLDTSSSTINQTQKEELERIWNESGLGTELLFNFLSSNFGFKIESWYHIPSEYFEDICVNLPEISEKIINYLESSQDY